MDPTSQLVAGRRAQALVHARQTVSMADTRAHRSVPRVSACGIPASMLLSVLDHDRAYFYLDACTVYRVPVDGYDIRIRFSLAKPAPPGVRFLSKS